MIKKFSVPKKRKKISPSACVEIGGHCWNEYHELQDTDEFGNITNPIIGLLPYTQFDDYITYRTCKHCGFTQKMEPVAKREWIDIGIKNKKVK